MYDFIVIGGGMAGVSMADALAPAARVALLEAEPQLGYHSTARSAALFAPAYGSTAFRILTRASEAFLEAPGAPGFPASLLSPRGALLIARADQAASLRAEIAGVRASGVSIVALTGEEARERVGALRATYVAAAAFEPGVRDIDVEGLFRGFIRRARGLGVEFHNAARWRAPRWQDGLWHLQLEDRQIRARVVINAAGAWADEVARQFTAAPLGLAVLRRSAALIDAPPGTDVAGWPAIFDAEDQFYLKPDAGRLLISPADEEAVAPGDAYAEDVTIAVAVERIQAALELDVRRVHRSWAGLRTFAPDRDPVIGYDAAVPGFFWCAGQGGYGIQTAFAFSRAAAALARREALPRALADEGLTGASLSPARFAGAPGPVLS
jgi:D-arginine dehydrogenase